MKSKRIKKPWGFEQHFTLNKKSTVKILTLLPKKRFSLQYHNNRSEFWRFLDNPAKVTLRNKTIKTKKGYELIIPKKTPHRIQALNKPVSVLEISIGNFSAKDIKRLEDDFGRK